MQLDLDPGTEWLLPFARARLAELKVNASRLGVNSLEKYLEVDPSSAVIESGFQIRVHTHYGIERISIRERTLPFYTALPEVEDTTWAPPRVEFRDFNHKVVSHFDVQLTDADTQPVFTSIQFESRNPHLFRPLDLRSTFDGSTLLIVEWLEPISGGSTINVVSGTVRLSIYRNKLKVGELTLFGYLTPVQKMLFNGRRIILRSVRNALQEWVAIDLSFDPVSGAASFSVRTLFSLSPDDPAAIILADGQFIPVSATGDITPIFDKGVAFDKTLDSMYVQGRVGSFAAMAVVKRDVNSLEAKTLWYDLPAGAGLGYQLRDFSMVHPIVADSGDVWFSTIAIKAGFIQKFDLWKNGGMVSKYSVESSPDHGQIAGDFHRHPYECASADGSRFVTFLYGFSGVSTTTKVIDTDHALDAGIDATTSGLVPTMFGVWPSYVAPGAAVVAMFARSLEGAEIVSLVSMGAPGPSLVVSQQPVSIIEGVAIPFSFYFASASDPNAFYSLDLDNLQWRAFSYQQPMVAGVLQPYYLLTVTKLGGDVPGPPLPIEVFDAIPYR